MAITNFISTVWSENLLTSLNSQYVGVANCSRDFEGEIKEKGSMVRICGVGNIAVNNYNKNSDMITQGLSDTSVDLCIDQAKYFNFQIDDVDKAQSVPKIMDAALRVAANSLAKVADQYIYDLASTAEHQLNYDDPTVDNILETIITAREKLYEKNVSDAEEVVLEVNPYIATMLLKAKAKISNTDDVLENGCIGKLYGCKVFVTKNISIVPDGSLTTYKCMMRTKRAIAFAEQVCDIIAYRPEKRFADAVKGLHLYGAKIVYPDELITINYTINHA